MDFIEKIKAAMEETGFKDITQPKITWTTMTAYVLSLMEHHMTYIGKGDGFDFGMFDGEHFPIPTVFEAKIKEMPVVYGVLGFSFDDQPIHEIAFLGYNGTTPQDKFFSPFLFPYATAAAVDSHTYASISMPYRKTEVIGADMPGIAPKPLMVPLYASWPKDLLEGAARISDLSIETYIRASLGEAGLKNLSIDYPVPTTEQVKMTAEITSILYTLHENRLKHSNS